MVFQVVPPVISTPEPGAWTLPTTTRPCVHRSLFEMLRIIPTEGGGLGLTVQDSMEFVNAVMLEEVRGPANPRTRE